MIKEKCKRIYILIKDFNRFMYDYTLHIGKKYFCRYCLQTFNTAEILKSNIKDCMKINDKQMIKMPKKGDSKIMRGKQNHHL